MKTSKRNKLLGLALVGGFSLFSASNVLAAAGDDISNTATLSYTVGGAAQTDIPASVTFQEDRKILFTVARTTKPDVGPGGLNETVAFTLTNNSNATLNFLLRAENSTVDDPFALPGSVADIFTPPGFRAMVDNNTNGIIDAGDTYYVSDLAAGGTVTILVESDMPTTRTDSSPLQNNDISTVRLIAQAAIPTTDQGYPTPEGAGTGAIGDAITADDNGNQSTAGSFQIADTGALAALTIAAASDAADDPDEVDTVFADALAIEGATSPANDGQFDAISTYNMVIAALTVSKTTTTIYVDINDISNPKAIGGANAVVRYTVRVENDLTGAIGAGPATLTTVTDDPPLAVDTKFGNEAVSGAPALSGTNNVRITDGAGTVVFCQADAAVDSCTYDGTTLLIDLTDTVGLGITNVLNSTEFLTIEFDVLVP